MEKLTKQHPLVMTVADTVKKWRMLAREDRVLIGLSGGADSVALLHILLQLAPDLNLNIGVAHLNHMLRGNASDEDARFVASLARKHHLPCFVTRKDIRALQKEIGAGIEDTGRHARYHFFNQTAKEHGFDKIATAHHADDSAEVVLMNLLRGSGPKGLCGIPPCRDGNIIRPLINARQRDIVAFVEAGNLAYVVDKSNHDTRFLRNRVRHELIPLLTSQYNPGFLDALVRFASVSHTEEAWINEMTCKMLETATIEKQPNRIDLSTIYLSGLHKAALRRILRGAIEYTKGNLNRIGFAHVESLVNLTLKGPDPGACHLPGKILARRLGYRISLSLEPVPLKSLSKSPLTLESNGYAYDVHKPDSTGLNLTIPETGQTIFFSVITPDEIADLNNTGQKSAFFDMEKLAFPLMLRNFQAGDRFFPLGMTGSQKVKNLFINTRVARDKRKSCPILLNNGQIVWVVGHRMDDRYKLDPATRHVLKAELLLA